MAEPTARLLDLTRSLRRVGRVATGVDRVELAYLSHLLTGDAPLYGVARTALGYVLLDRAGMQGFYDRLAASLGGGETFCRACHGGVVWL